jgi:hypothetical protein
VCDVEQFAARHGYEVGETRSGYFLAAEKKRGAVGRRLRVK